jgi:transcriptional regulator with XRE-family HTH domain
VEDYDLYKKLIGKKLYLLRTEMNLTLEEVAQKTGINDKHLGRIERGEKMLGMKTILKLNAFLNIDLNILVQEAKEHLRSKHTEE